VSIARVRQRQGIDEQLMSIDERIQDCGIHEIARPA
jgi:hypothetical protein